MEYIGNIRYDDYLLENRKFIIYGAGICGQKIYEYLKTNKREQNVLFFCDKKLNSEKLFNIEIIHPADAVNISGADFLVAGKYEHEMIDFLLNHGVRKIHLLFI